LVHGVAKDVELLQFNTAIAKMMEFINDFTKLPTYPRPVLKMAIQALAPFAPHLAEEAWQQIGCEESLSYTPFPIAEERYLQDEVVTYVVQIDGKLRGRLELPKDKGEEEIFEAARGHANIKHFLEGQKIAKVFFVPNKLLNIVLDK